MKQILILEDDLALSTGLCFELDSAGYITVAAYNCQKARQLLDGTRFDLALLDVNLPDGNGFDLCREIKAAQPELPVIFLTANDLEQDILGGFDMGAEDYVTKPFNMQILLRRVEVALRRAGAKRSAPRTERWSDGWLTLDFSALTAQRGGKNWPLPPRISWPIGRATTPPAPSAGSTVELNGRAYTVMAVVYPLNPVTLLPVQQDAGNKFSLNFILPAETFRGQWPDHTLRKLFLNVDEYRETTDPGLPVASRQTMAEQYEVQTRSSAVMGNTVSVVIALVGVLNFINSMVTAIVSRKREFAVIQSVGMTKKQLGRMLVNEGLFYAVLTLGASYLISSLAVGIVVRAMVEGGFTTFRFTLLPLLICTPILLIFAVLIPHLCFRNLEKHSIVERLRME